MNSSTTLKVALTAAVATVLCVNNASALLTWDLRAVSVAGGGTVDGPKGVTTVAGSTSVTFDVWAVVTGTNGIVDETLQSGFGMILSNGTLPPSTVALDPAVVGNTAILATANTLKGNFEISPVAKGNLIAPWDTSSTASNGTVRDLNGDAALDIGGSSSASSTGFMLVNGGALLSTGNVGDFNTLSNGREWRVARYVFTITSGAQGGGTGVNFAVPLMSALAAAARASYNSDGGAVETGSVAANLAVGAPVIVGVPEPSAFGMLALGAMGLVGFRRLGLRRA